MIKRVLAIRYLTVEVLKWIKERKHKKKMKNAKKLNGFHMQVDPQVDQIMSDEFIIPILSQMTDY